MRLNFLHQTYDLAVIGGGIVGSGIARDAALRGLTVVLFEQGDFGSGTSSRTSRMVHGGIRYLEQGAFRLVFEASRERALLLRLAPHLVRPLPFLFPIYPETGRPAWMIRAGMLLYDLMALFRNVHRHRMLTSAQFLALEPGLASEGLRGGALFYDAQMDDARLCLEVLLSARSAGAEVHNYTAVEGIAPEAHGGISVSVRSHLTGEEAVIRARQVVNAAGPWLDRVAGLEDPERRSFLRTTQGSHLLVPRLTRSHAVVVTSQRDRRLFFVLPWRRDTLIGTTDLDYKGDPSKVRTTPEEVDYLLEATRRFFPASRLSSGEILARFAGVRPLPQEGAVSPSALSRETELHEGPLGILSVVAGKYTLHRRTAEKVVDRLFQKLSRRPPASQTARLPLWGGGFPSLQTYLEEEVPRAAADSRIDPGVVRHLVEVYGSRYPALLERIRRDRSLGDAIVQGEPEILAQVDYAVEEEMAFRLSDVLQRRTGLALSRRRRDPRMLRTVVSRMGRLLSWDADRQAEEVDAYLNAIE